MGCSFFYAAAAHALDTANTQGKGEALSCVRFHLFNACQAQHGRRQTPKDWYAA